MGLGWDWVGICGTGCEGDGGLGMNGMCGSWGKGKGVGTREVVRALSHPILHRAFEYVYLRSDTSGYAAAPPMPLPHSTLSFSYLSRSLSLTLLLTSSLAF